MIGLGLIFRRASILLLQMEKGCRRLVVFFL
jgi:hypothetical protein